MTDDESPSRTGDGTPPLTGEESPSRTADESPTHTDEGSQPRTPEEPTSRADAGSLSRKERRALLGRKEDAPAAATGDAPKKKGRQTWYGRIYEHKYKKLLIIPLALFFIAIIVIAAQVATTGDFVKRGISLKGGIEIKITSDMANIGSLDLATLQQQLQADFPNYEIKVGEEDDFGVRTGVTIDASFEDQPNINKLVQLVTKAIPGTTAADLQANLITMGSTLSQNFFQTAMIAVVVAFLFMGIVVFVTYRNIVVSSNVIFAALADIVTTLAVVDILHVELSTSGVAAFLMLIGYSVDTDILLSTRVLKRKGETIYSKVISAVKTGMGMTLTTLVAVLAGLFFSLSADLHQIFLIIFIGLICDIIYTWLMNAGMLRLYLAKRKEE